MAASNRTPYGAQWPDVAIALIEFAMEQPAKFVFIFVLVCAGAWLLLPRFTYFLRRNYQSELLKQKGQDDVPGNLPSKDNDDV